MKHGGASVWPPALLKGEQVRMRLKLLWTHSVAFAAGGAVPQQDFLSQADAAGSLPRAGGGGQAGVRHLHPHLAGLVSGLGLRGVFVDEVWN